MTRAKALEESRNKLITAGFSEGLLEAEVLLRHALQMSRAELYSSLDTTLTRKERSFFNVLILRRLGGEPVSYIIEHREFYGLDFFVDSRVLIPRPETEMLVEEAIRLTRGLDKPVICDVGTGSGAIAVSLAKHIPAASIYGIDIMPECIEVARRNAALHEVRERITFLTCDLLSALPEKVDIIIANLPYVKTSEVWMLNEEPATALDGGEDGLDAIRRLIAQIEGHLTPGGKCLLEIGINQNGAVRDIINDIIPGARVKTSRDLAGIVRMLTVTLPQEMDVDRVTD